ncbi:phage tail protein [Paenibacillus sp. NEAU-GSW1]|uniref:phage tail protein n=1 Tax=Paenibacillus sp. NEAU-GSW1 TaxID=2682486 RepID=UPI0012E3144A|nr:tail fiber protein [Paenibacillus sp. NEAU-GSW1]MUT64595.1 phage tail protein [Paenibacillus sp. NEAU-GSW1]
MSDYFLGEIRAFPYSRGVPKGWMECKGQLLPISTNSALFSLLGVMYGGNGTINFALPNLQGRAVIHGMNPLPGKPGGEEMHTLTVDEMPAHTHAAKAGQAVSTTDPTNAVWGKSSINNYGQYASATMSTDSLNNSGSSQPHNNMQPYLAVRYCIAIAGIYPPRN